MTSYSGKSGGESNCPCDHQLLLPSWPSPSASISVVNSRKAPNSTLTRNSSGDEIANVNFLYDDIVHALKID